MTALSYVLSGGFINADTELSVGGSPSQYLIGDSVALPKNYTEEIIEHTHKVGDVSNQIKAFAIVFVAYFLLLEILLKSGLYQVIYPEIF